MCFWRTCIQLFLSFEIVSQVAKSDFPCIELPLVVQKISKINPNTQALHNILLWCQCELSSSSLISERLHFKLSFFYQNIAKHWLGNSTPENIHLPYLPHCNHDITRKTRHRRFDSPVQTGIIPPKTKFSLKIKNSPSHRDSN
jgi:hypothetical protein